MPQHKNKRRKAKYSTTYELAVRLQRMSTGLCDTLPLIYSTDHGLMKRLSDAVMESLDLSLIFQQKVDVHPTAWCDLSVYYP